VIAGEDMSCSAVRRGCRAAARRGQGRCPFPPGPGPPGGLVLRGQQVGLGHHPGHVPTHDQHRHRADLVLGQQASDLLVGGDPVNGHDLCGHDIADRAVPSAVVMRGVVRAGAGPGSGAGLLGQTLLDRGAGSCHVGRAGSAVQGLVVGGAEVAEHGVQMGIGASVSRAGPGWSWPNVASGRDFGHHRSRSECGVAFGAQDETAESVVGAIAKSVSTGTIGDGKIWVSSVDSVLRVRTGERDRDAV